MRIIAVLNVIIILGACNPNDQEGFLNSQNNRGSGALNQDSAGTAVPGNEQASGADDVVNKSIVGVGSGGSDNGPISSSISGSGGEGSAEAGDFSTNGGTGEGAEGSSADGETSGDPNEISTSIGTGGDGSLEAGGEIPGETTRECPPQSQKQCRPGTRIAPDPLEGSGVRFQGRVFWDKNSNGRFDGGDQPIQGAFIHLDWDGDCRPDLGEPNINTGVDGSYSITLSDDDPTIKTHTDPEDQVWKVLLIQPSNSGFVQTFPRFGDVYILDGKVKPGAQFRNLNFAMDKLHDLGDAPDSYGTSVEANGASHVKSAHLDSSLGLQPDFEQAPRYDSRGLGDNFLSECSIADEDGVDFERLKIDEKGKIKIKYQSHNRDSFITGWIDFNRNGAFEDSERVVHNMLVRTSGEKLSLDSKTVEFNFPANIVVGDTYARFRIAAVRLDSPTGEVAGGEVEDYKIRITGP